MPPIPGTPSPNVGATLAPFADVLVKVNDVLRTVVPQFDKVYTTVRDLTQQFGEWLVKLVPFKESLDKVQQAFVSIATVAPKVAGAVASLGASIAGIVAKANPAVAEQFNLALNDTLAVIGQALVPVLQVATQLLRLFADAMAGFSREIGEALGEIFSALMPVFEVFVEVFARLLSVVAEVLKAVAPLIRMVAEGIKTIFDWLGRAIRFLLDLIGIELGDSPLKRGASTGAAVRQASIGSVEGLIQKAQVSAFSLGTAAGPNYAAETANNTREIWVRIGSLAEAVQAGFDWVKNHISGPAGDVADAIRDGFDAIVDDVAGRAGVPPTPREVMPFFGDVARGIRLRAGDGSGAVKPSE